MKRDEQRAQRDRERERERERERKETKLKIFKKVSLYSKRRHKQQP